MHDHRCDGICDRRQQQCNLRNDSQIDVRRCQHFGAIGWVDDHGGNCADVVVIARLSRCVGQFRRWVPHRHPRPGAGLLHGDDWSFDATAFPPHRPRRLRQIEGDTQPDEQDLLTPEADRSHWMNWLLRAMVRSKSRVSAGLPQGVRHLLRPRRCTIIAAMGYAIVVTRKAQLKAMRM